MKRPSVVLLLRGKRPAKPLDVKGSGVRLLAEMQRSAALEGKRVAPTSYAAPAENLSQSVNTVWHVPT